MFQAFRSLLTVSFHRNFGLPLGRFPSVFISATARMFSVSPLPLTCPNHSNLRRLITVAIASTFALWLCFHPMCRERQQDLHCVFIDLGKAYDRVPREKLYWSMRDKGVPEKYIRLMKDMYHQCETVLVRCVAGTSEPFAVEVGLHQASAFSPFLFAIMMDSQAET